MKRQCPLCSELKNLIFKCKNEYQIAGILLNIRNKDINIEITIYILNLCIIKG